MSGISTVMKKLGYVRATTTTGNSDYAKVVKRQLVLDKQFATKELMEEWIAELKALGSTSVAPAPIEHKPGRSYYARVRVI